VVSESSVSTEQNWDIVTFILFRETNCAFFLYSVSRDR
jgi:hypothetical protein